MYICWFLNSFTSYILSSEAHNSLTAAVGEKLGRKDTTPRPTSSAASIPDPNVSIPSQYLGLNKANAAQRFPNIKFWTQQDYNARLKSKKVNSDVIDVDKPKPLRGSSRKNEGENVSMDYIEQEDGSIIDGHATSAIRDYLRLVFNEMGSRIPEKWSLIGISERQYVFSQLYKQFPYLLLCLDEWKPVYLAGRALSSYHATLKKRGNRQNIKNEVKAEMTSTVTVANNIQDDSVNGGKKRKSHDETLAASAKRLCSTSISPTSPIIISSDTLSSSASSSEDHSTSPPVPSHPVPSSGSNLRVIISPPPTLHDVAAPVSVAGFNSEFFSIAKQH